METLIDQLKVILGTNFGLYFKAHSFHWNVEGPDFVQYHEFLGDFYTKVWEQTDAISEKIRMLGSYSPTSLSRIIELSDVEENDAIPMAVTMFSELKRDNDRMIVHLRAGIVAAENANEPAIGNFLQDLLDSHQKYAWMFRSIIK
jgi:starvation-inducible DNA-binding protein